MTKIKIPKDGEVLTVQLQNDIPQIWILVVPLKEKVKRIFRCYGTGKPMPDNPGKYIGTFQWSSLVYHVLRRFKMERGYCSNCQKKVSYKRELGLGTFLMIIMTMGFGIFLLPFYPKRCKRCGEPKRLFQWTTW